jgi:AcrR family transcriptional regulator
MAGADRKPSGNVDVAVRERLLQTAVDSFARFGFEGSSLRAIAQEAGVAFQLITYYFGSKEDLWLATVDHLYGEREKLGPTAFDPSGDFEVQLRDWIRHALEQSIR